MGITEHFSFTAVHAHTNLLGWVSMTLIAVLYKLFPAMEESKLAPVHFWVYQIGFPCFVCGLAAMAMNAPRGLAVPLVAAGGTVTLIGIILTAVVVWGNVKVATALAGKSRAV